MTVEVITELPSLPPRPADSNKGTFGRVLVVAGSRGMSGAAVLCGSAALRGGAGLVSVAAPEEVLPVVAAGNSCYLTAPLAPVVLTPHPGEFARLVGLEVPAVQARRRELAVRFAAEHGVVLVLKGHGTVVSDGRRVFVNATGNAGMATGGTGDVLTGLVAALLAQGLEPFAAAQLGVYLHGLAGDLARDAVGEVALIATDLVTYLPQAF